jgi:hypothetical protein
MELVWAAIFAATILAVGQVACTWLNNHHEAGQAALDRHAEAVEHARDRAAKLTVLGHSTHENGTKEAVVPISESHSVSN